METNILLSIELEVLFNLTRASEVLILDLRNPAVEEQATDRAHRIGQDSRYDISIHYTKHNRITIREMHKRKKDVADQITSTRKCHTTRTIAIFIG